MASLVRTASKKTLLSDMPFGVTLRSTRRSSKSQAPPVDISDNAGTPSPFGASLKSTKKPSSLRLPRFGSRKSIDATKAEVVAAASPAPPPTAAAPAPSPVGAQLTSDKVEQALVGLGYPILEARRAAHATAIPDEAYETHFGKAKTWLEARISAADLAALKDLAATADEVTPASPGAAVPAQATMTTAAATAQATPPVVATPPAPVASSPPPASAKAKAPTPPASLEAAARGGSTRAIARLAHYTQQAAGSVRRSFSSPSGDEKSAAAAAAATPTPAGTDIKSMWQAFMDANEVLDAVAAYKALRAACGVPDDASGRVAFDSTLAAVVGSNVPHKNKSLIQGLADNWKLRPTPKESAAPVRVVISGAGPVGLRAAVEAALNGFTVHVLEKRDIFSRVNILMLWQQTADDLVAYGARSFYTKFTNRNIGNSPLHLGTREIQLVFLKNALLLGVTFSYGSELVAVQAPASGEGCWRAIARTAASTETHQTTGGVLDFKPNKMSDYSSGAGQGKCNMLQQSDLDGTFALSADTPLPSEVLGLEFDALLLAEGEWSPTCKRLGITKSIDRFTTAIGLVINMVLDPSEPKTKDPKMRSFTISPLDEIGRALKAAKIDFEFGEYLKGETHYIVLTIKKATLLAFGVLREDLSGPNLLTKANLDEPKLMTLSRQIATVIGLPESVEFTGFHPAKLFDFSTRARCLAPFRILGVRSGGAQAGQVAGMDLEAQPFLKESESKWYDRALADAEAEVAKRHKEREELEKAISDVSATLQQSMEAAADTMIDKVNKMVQSKAPPTLESRNSGVQDDEWEDSDDEERRKLSEQIAAQKAASERLTRSQLTQDRLDRQAMEKANAMQAGSGGGGDDDELGEDGKRKLTPEEVRETRRRRPPPLPNKPPYPYFPTPTSSPSYSPRLFTAI